VVAHEPIRALVTHLTPKVNPDSLCVDVYPVSSIPLNAKELAGGQETYSGAIDIAKRARQLENFRDATLDRRMTTLVSQTLPGDRAVWWPGRGRGEPAHTERYLRANVFPIEVNASRSVNSKLMEASTIKERRQVIAEAVADGCRSSLEVMLHQTLSTSDEKIRSVSCRKTVADRLEGPRFLPGAGEKDEDGPGLPEVCRACVLRPKDNPEAELHKSLGVPKRDDRRPDLPEWSVVGKPPAPRASREMRNAAEDEQKGLDRASRQHWPRSRVCAADVKEADTTRPTISLLFSGGVFRGVYLAGVINALNEAGVSPDLIAGSSIGSITAAMAARVFCETDRDLRKRQIVDVAATYIAVDRLVLTDRFSDFIRNFTLRASAAGFSLKDLDTAFRAFDRSGTSSYGRQMRNVLAGLERLFYVSPFEARDVVKAFRLRRYAEARSLLEDYVQEWLERGAVGLEVLGAEPLAILIREHVLNRIHSKDPDPAAGFVQLLQGHGIQFIATATNITRGRLDIKHLPPIDAAGEGTRAIEALLASSAFPGVFRPRWSWEVNPKTNEIEQYIDGGVMDNLPLDAVADFLNEARHQQRIPSRPVVDGGEVPHLLFTGSLEVEGADLTAEQTEAIAWHWRRIRKRAAELKYNKKTDNYARTQTDLRRVYECLRGESKLPYEPLNLEVVVVKPKWLCGTFAFHPMLGFRRVEQARSIAHGCMTTLKKLEKLGRDHPDWVKAWGIKQPAEWSDGPERKRRELGHCWYRKGCVCPFSEQGLGAIEGTEAFKPATRRALSVIYKECGKAATHEASNG
jgi:predicted acylesterase/phospholipase RssA